MISPVSTIERKRDGEELNEKEIHEFVQGILNGTVTDYQATAWLMSVYFNGMSLKETVALTHAMTQSGTVYDLSHIPGAKVDKHSTGGVGDKVSLILAPLAAACGLKVPMMSGRGLGHTGGTLDKLESIPGFRMNLERQEFEKVLSDVGCAMIGQTKEIAPADKKLYALRDVTGTVECIPLIVASILSKKIAEGADGLVFDVKVGSGAFMKRKNDARTLARTLIHVGKKAGLQCRAVLSNMDQPLGYACGNAIEILESAEILRNEKSGTTLSQPDVSSCDLKELTVQLCAQMLQMGKVVKTLPDGRKLAHQKLQDGSAWEAFEKLCAAQGGSLEWTKNPQSLLGDATLWQWKPRKRGYIVKMDTYAIGKIIVELGGGRMKAEDSVDPTVGLAFHKKLGSKVAPGEPVVSAWIRPKTDQNALEKALSASISISGTRKPVPKLILDPNIK